MAIAVFAVFVQGCSSPGVQDSDGAFKVILLHTNDHHGTVLPIDGQGGLAERATFVKQVRERAAKTNTPVLILDAGDVNTGSALSNMFEAEPDFKCYDAIGYDCMTFGNHEFDRMGNDSSAAKLVKQLEWADFPIISANIKKSDGAFFGDAPDTGYVVKVYTDAQGQSHRFGIFGLTTCRTVEIASPDKSLTFADEVDSAKAAVSALRMNENVDVVIALTHIGDVEEAPDHTTSVKLAQEVDGIDIIVDGHSHTDFITAHGGKPVIINGGSNKTAIVSASEWGKEVGYGVITIKDGVYTDFDWHAEAINTADPATTYAPDPDVNAIIKPFKDQVDASLTEVIGRATAEFPYDKQVTRSKESALGDMVCDASVWYLAQQGKDVDFAFFNSGSFRAAIAKGDITRENVLTTLPHVNTVFVVSLTGEEVVKLFDFIGTIEQGAGAFPQFSSGARVVIDKTQGAGKITSLSIGGKKVDNGKTYRVCTNDYIVNEGDGYPLGNATDIYNSSALLSDVVCDYIKAQKGGAITPKTDGRLTVKGGVN
jgi:5'-nucleotidase/UDP-sugar diphosphatase